jgi:hypothetical protein
LNEPFNFWTCLVDEKFRDDERMIEIGKRKNSFVAVGDSEDEVEDTSSRGRKKIKI